MSELMILAYFASSVLELAKLLREVDSKYQVIGFVLLIGSTVYQYPGTILGWLYLTGLMIYWYYKCYRFDILVQTGRICIENDIQNQTDEYYHIVRDLSKRLSFRAYLRQDNWKILTDQLNILTILYYSSVGLISLFSSDNEQYFLLLLSLSYHIVRSIIYSITGSYTKMILNVIVVFILQTGILLPSSSLFYDLLILFLFENHYYVLISSRKIIGSIYYKIF